jgi:hypothetical protein
MVVFSDPQGKPDKKVAGAAEGVSGREFIVDMDVGQHHSLHSTLIATSGAGSGWPDPLERALAKVYG